MAVVGCWWSVYSSAGNTSLIFLTAQDGHTYSDLSNSIPTKLIDNMLAIKTSYVINYISKTIAFKCIYNYLFSSEGTSLVL